MIELSIYDLALVSGAGCIEKTVSGAANGATAGAAVGGAVGQYSGRILEARPPYGSYLGVKEAAEKTYGIQ